MRGLSKLPQAVDLLEAYERLSFFSGMSENIDEATLGLLSQWTRFDARLGELLVQFLLINWKNINPLKLNSALLYQPWSAAMGVLLEFVNNGNRTEQSLYRSWKSTVLDQVNPVDFQLYFFDAGRIGGQFQQNEASLPLIEYTRWGFLSREVLFNKPSEKLFRTHHYSKASRLRILDDLLKVKGRITAAQYRQSLGNSVTTRTAERDLESHTGIKKMGKTRGSFFVKRK